MRYDVFLSHNWADKEWTRALNDRLATTDYNGRTLRAWLDEEVIDPGDLSSHRELESALDRSRFLAVVLSPEALASRWVRSEIDYFLGVKPTEHVVLIGRRPCAVPDELRDVELIEWPDSADGERQWEELLAFLRPRAGRSTEHEHRRAVRRAWGSARVHQPDAFDPTPTDANSALLELLLSHDISDLDEEGLALAGFDRVGQLLAELDADDGYGLKMVLGEFLTIAIVRDSGYRRVAADYVRRDERTLARPSFLTVRNRALGDATGPVSTTNLLLAVARAGSKLAEIEPSRIDLSTLAAVLHRLDQRPTLGDVEQSVAMMIGRTLGKLRGTDLVDVLVHTLVRWGGDASHVAAATAISTAYDTDDALVYYTDELAALAPDRSEPAAFPPPSPSIARLLLDPVTTLRTNSAVHGEVMRAVADFERSFGTDWPLGTGLWSALGYSPVPIRLEEGPLVGTVRRVTLADMETLADTLTATDVACLTEPRIVDALLGGAGGYLIDEQQANEPLAQRLRHRGARFAAFDRAGLDRLADGAVLALWPQGDGSAWGFTASPSRGV